jgi:hypothetical protein
VCEENEGAREHATMLLKRRDKTLNDLSAFIEADDALAKEMDTVRGPVFITNAQNGEPNSETQTNDLEMTQAEQPASAEETLYFLDNDEERLALVHNINKMAVIHYVDVFMGNNC